ncbi:hypothetical protein ACTJKN_02940 [Pedobacter sp. 22163]|uniref:hypothetical protein n=1 Tax=Pedobacter sp. 22163 TaxID=3453883 RepID=UPI003F857D8D
MENLPSIFDSLWEFLAVPLIEVLVLLFFFYYFADRTSIKNWFSAKITLVKTGYPKIKDKITPAGTVTSLSIAIAFIVIIAGISRFAHTIGDIIPGNLMTSDEYAMASYSTPEDLAKIWSSNPKIADFDELYAYIQHQHYKQLSTFPDLASANKTQFDSFGKIWANRSLYKFILLYLLILQPVLFKVLQIKTKRYIPKLLICLLIITTCLLYTFKEHSDHIKISTYLRTHNVRIMLEPEIINGDTKHLTEYRKKIETYLKDRQEAHAILFYPSSLSDIADFKDL